MFASVGRLAYNHSCWKHLVKDSQEEKKQQQQREVVIANNHHHHIQPSAVAAAATVQHVAANMFLNGVVPQGLVVEQAGLGVHETLDKGQIQECISQCHQLIGSLYRMGLDKAVVRECIPHCHEVLTKLHKQL